MFLLLLLILAVATEGLGIDTYRLVPYILIATTAVLALIVSLPNLKIKISRLSFLISMFFLVSIATVLVSKIVRISILYLLLYFSIAAISFFIYSNKQVFSKLLVNVVLALGVFFSIYSTFLASFASKMRLLIPKTGYQFVSSRYGSHNHLGDFLVLPLIACFYFLLNKKYSGKSNFVYLMLTLFFVPFFLFSYSRSAYAALILASVLMVFDFAKNKTLKISKIAIIALILMISIAGLFLFSIGKTPDKSFLSQINRQLTKRNELSYKSVWGERNEYLSQAIYSIRDYPVLGVGPGNFGYSSRKYMEKKRELTESAHNIFFDTFVENGIPATILFILIIAELLIKSRKNVYLYMAIGALINFQTDYTYRIYTFVLLFFVLLALSYEDRSENT